VFRHRKSLARGAPIDQHTGDQSSTKEATLLLILIIPDASIDFTHRFFTSITHLEIVNVAQNIKVEVWSALTRLPHLTHLAFNSYRYLEMCLAILLTWENLRALVILSLFDSGEKSLEQHNVPELAQEPRLVVIACSNFCDDWARGATLGRDYWAQAEDFIVKRRSRKIDRGLLRLILELY
jgi:hypothetical protein